MLPKRRKMNGVMSEVKSQNLFKVVPPKKVTKSSRISMPPPRLSHKSMKALFIPKDLLIA